MFNLKAHKLAEKTEVTQEKQLEDKHDPVDGLEDTQALLDGSRTNKDVSEITEGQLDHSEKPVQTIEAMIDAQDLPDGYPKRTGNDRHDQLPINLKAELADKKRAADFEKARTSQDTSFWDKYVGDEMLGKGTKALNKTGPSQLHNHQDRFDGLTEDGLLKNKGVRDMVMASLQDADAMLYYIYRQAAENDRALTAEEKNIIEGITRDKIDLLRRLKANGGLVCQSCGKSMAAVKELCDDCESKGKKSKNPDDPAYYANRAAIQAREE